MKNQYVLVVLFTLVVNILYSQIEDDFEDYTVGEPVNADWWLDNCGGTGPGCELMSSDTYAHWGNKSGYIPGDGTTDVVADHGNKIFSLWYAQYFLYIPEGKEARIRIWDRVPVAFGNPVMGDIYFNPQNTTPGEGFIDNIPGGPYTFSFEHSTWFYIYIKVDIFSGISLATCEIRINSTTVVPDGTPFTDAIGTIPQSYGGLEFESVSNLNEVYIDDVYFGEDQEGCYGINESDFLTISIFPNPVSNILIIKAKEVTEQVKIYDVVGQLLLSKNNSNEIDVSNLPSGIYLLCFKNGRNIGFQKFIKE